MIDWNLIRSFVAVVDDGTLSRAAATLGISQPTLGRHIDELEKALGVTLFMRGRHGMRPTEAALSIVEEARAMAAGADRLSLKAAGRATTIAGTVRITASEVVGTHFLPSILADFSEAEPEIEIELVPSNRVENLLSRDADIAVRMVRPAQSDLVARKVTDMAIGAFADGRYLDRHGRPATLGELVGHRLIGFDRDETLVNAMQSMGIAAARHSFTFRTDNQVAYWELVRAGAGIGFGSRHLASLTPSLEELFTDIAFPTLPIWLASHRDLRTSLKIGRTMDFLYDALRSLPLALAPRRTSPRPGSI